MEFVVGWLVASLMGAGTLYIVITVFALAFPRLFRVLYWLLMLPVMALGSTPFGWLFLGFFFGWNESTLKLSAVLSTIFAVAFCVWSDPKQT